MILSETDISIILNKESQDVFEGRQSTVLSHLVDGKSSFSPDTQGRISFCHNGLGGLLKRLQKQS